MNDANDPEIADTEGIRRAWRDVDRPSEAVVELVADATDSDPLELPVLHDTVDTDALDALYGTDDEQLRDVAVEFSYAGFDVTVAGGEYVEARPR